MRRVLIVAISVCFSTPALSSQCPDLWQQINEKMAGTHSPNVDRIQLAELRQKGEALHHAGKHAEAEDTLVQALTLLD